MPELSLKSSDKILLQYSIPTNYFAYNSRGVEFDIDFGRINSIRTSFGLNGSWTQTNRGRTTTRSRTIRQAAA